MSKYIEKLRLFLNSGGVSEPVISFVKTFKENPRRFQMTSYSGYIGEVFYLFDTKAWKKYTIGKSYHVDGGQYMFNLLGLGFELTKYEEKYLIENVCRYYEDRAERYKELKALRACRKLYEVYK